MNQQENILKIKDEVINVKVKNQTDEYLGRICEVMVDKVSGQVAYAVLECGSILGMGGQLFALPWDAIRYDPNKGCFILSADKATF